MITNIFVEHSLFASLSPAPRGVKY